jgi:zinc transporter ZupT
MTNGVFWTKIVFIVVCWCEAFFSGCFPTWSAGCRENPKILGIANAFASGVFLAIALIHILPEEVDIYYNELHAAEDDLFPLPYFLMWTGYTIILVIDKVMFDTSALFKENEDPAQRKLSQALEGAGDSGQNPDS